MELKDWRQIYWDILADKKRIYYIRREEDGSYRLAIIASAWTNVVNIFRLKVGYEITKLEQRQLIRVGNNICHMSITK